MLEPNEPFMPKTIIISKKKPIASGNDIALILTSKNLEHKNELSLISKLGKMYFYTFNGFFPKIDDEFIYLGSFPKPLTYNRKKNIAKNK